MNLSQTISDEIGGAIVSGRMEPGTVLGETAITARGMGGRGAVREALKMLEAKGLIEARPRRGTTVLPVDRWNLYDEDVQAWMRSGGPCCARPVWDSHCGVSDIAGRHVQAHAYLLPHAELVRLQRTARVSAAR